jgi:hypothetical protein
MTYSWHTGEIVGIIPDGGIEWTVLEFVNKKPDILSVPREVLENAGVYLQELGAKVLVLLNNEATCEIEQNPKEFRPLS